MSSNPYIEVSGQTTFEELKIEFPSGVFNVPVVAFLSAINATFGFNATAHRFDLEYIPADFSATALPTIGSGVTFTIGDNFFVKGRIKHADYATSSQGKVLNISIEDLREDLNDTYIDTNGLLGSSDPPPNNVVDVRYWYIKNFVETRVFARSRIVNDLKLIEQQGVSYRQLYDAVRYFEEQVGNITNVLSKLPDPEVVESQLPEDPDAYRWKFISQPLIEVVNKVMDDISYDWYWNMSNDKVNVINRKLPIEIDENAIPIAGDTSPTVNKRFGRDEGERPTAVRILGTRMEGLVGSGTLMTQTGAYGLSSGTYDLGIEVGEAIYEKGWTARLKYFGPDGFLNEYVPTDRELAMSLKSIEHWALEKELDNRIANSTIDPNTAITVEQRSVTGSGMGLLPSRRQEGRSWIVEWYNRVRTHAQNHFGRTYVLGSGTPLYGHIDNIDVISAAWCNLENQTDEGSFADNYKISDRFKFLSRFWVPEANKMRGWTLMASGTKWGLDGESMPTESDGWNESPDDALQYIPVEVKKWDTAVNKFQEEFLSALENQEKGISVRLPNIAWSRFTTADSGLQRVHRLGSLDQIFNNDLVSLDIPDPFRLAVPYEQLENVAIPIQVKRRYGLAFPSVWASGTGVAFEFQIRDDLAPWNYEPRGLRNSTQQMDSEAKGALTSRIVSRNTVTYAEVLKVGLPVISFDTFANQSQGENGFGVVSHGTTSLSLSRSRGGAWQTRYNVKTHFPDFLKIKPIKKAVGEDFNFSIKRLVEEPIPAPPPFTVDDFFDIEIDDGRKNVKSDTGIEHVVERNVTITNVFDRGENEYYLGIDSQGLEWPRALSVGFGGSNLKIANAIDGFLQVGMPAIYHLEKRPDGSIIHYFIGGIPLTAGRVVELTSSPRLVESIWVADTQTLQTTVTSPIGNEQVAVTPFQLLEIPFLSQTNVDTSLAVGDKIVVSSHGNKKDLVPGVSYGPNSERFNDAFLVNAGGAQDTIFPALVNTSPNVTTGRNGVITRVTDGQQFTDTGTVGGNTYNIFFVGAEFDQIEQNDYGVVFQIRETDGSADFRLYILIIKPLFMGTNAFGG
jgi:hypothetical protein